MPRKSSDQKAGSYAHQAHQGFSGAWNPSGLAPDAEKELASRGLIAKPAKASGRQRPASTPAGKPTPPGKPTSPGKPTTSSRDLEAELPSRSKRKRPVKSRHFRFPQEIDEKLEYLAEVHETTLVYVVCKAIQEEWLRTMRQQRRDERAAADAAPVDEEPEDAGEPS